MAEFSSERAAWLAHNILPMEPQLRAWLRRVLPAGLEVDDVIQEAYAKLASLPLDAKVTHPKAYVYQIVKRLVADHLRRAAVVTIDSLEETTQLSSVAWGFTPERIVSGRQELEYLYRAIGRLPISCRAVFVMRKIDGLPQKAIAAELGISEKSVEKRMSRALRILLKQMEEGGEAGERLTMLELGSRKRSHGA